MPLRGSWYVRYRRVISISDTSVVSLIGVHLSFAFIRILSAAKKVCPVVTQKAEFYDCLLNLKLLYRNEMTTNAQTDLLQRLESGYSLPVLSLVAIRLVELASDEECSVNDLVSLIEKDPSLAIRLLKVANSAFFRTAEPATTLRQAVIRIGFQQLRIMALSLSFRDTFPMGTIGGFDYERFWRASLYRALMAKSLAEQIGTCNPEEAFVAGLTLGVGFLDFF